MIRHAGVPCFWLEPTGREGIRLRRFTFRESECPGTEWGHDASSRIIAYVRSRTRPSEHGDVRVSPRDRARSHRAWPKTCAACGYVFGPGDPWQTNGDPEWRRADTGELIVAEASHLPPGALFHWGWDPWSEWRDRYGDGINLNAVCPNGSLWCVDGPARQDGRTTKPEAWTRTGDPRTPGTLTVSPSIIAGDYHGWLGINGAAPGHFSDDLGG